MTSAHDKDRVWTANAGTSYR